MLPRRYERRAGVREAELCFRTKAFLFSMFQFLDLTGCDPTRATGLCDHALEEQLSQRSCEYVRHREGCGPDDRTRSGENGASAVSRINVLRRKLGRRRGLQAVSVCQRLPRLRALDKSNSSLPDGARQRFAFLLFRLLHSPYTHAWGANRNGLRGDFGRGRWAKTAQDEFTEFREIVLWQPCLYFCNC